GLDVIAPRRRFRNGQPVLPQALKVELRCAADVEQHLFDRLARCYAAGEVGNIGREIIRTALDYDRVPHLCSLSPNLSLIENALQRSRMNLITGMPRYRNPSTFLPVLILAMATAIANQMPAIVFDQFDQVLDLHAQSRRKSANRFGANSQYRTMCWIFLWPN